MGSKVVIFFGYNNPLLYKRGVENVIWSQANAVPEAKVYYLYFDLDKDCLLQWGNIEVIGIRKDAMCYVSLNSVVGKLIRKHKRANVIIHAHHYLMASFLWWRTDLFTVHDALYYLARENRRNKLITGVHYLLEKWVYARCRFIHVISRYTKQQSLVGNRSNVEVIGNTSVLEGRENGGVSTSVPMVLSVRGIEIRAGIELLIAAAEYFQNEKIELEFCVAGKGPLLEHYRAMVKKKNLQNITFAGYVSDEALIDYYQRASFVVVTSLFGEGFGLPVIDGYLFDKPVIASDVCAIPEVIIDRSFLFHNNVGELVAKIKQMLQTTHRQHQFRKYYDDNFSNAVIEQRYRNLYHKLKPVSHP